jgi:PhnB protein
MTMKLNPYITFRGNAEEAIRAYGDVFGGDVSVSHFREFGMDADGVMHASLTTPEGFTLFVSDHVDGTFSLVDGNNIQVSLSGDDETALRRYWDGLADGGQVVVPLEAQMWGDVYGMVADRFGVLWHVNIVGPATTA